MNVVNAIVTPESSQISAIAYDEQAGILAIEFRSNNATYHYFDVPLAVFESFKAAESKGRFFGANIKGKFEYQKQP